MAAVPYISAPVPAPVPEPTPFSFGALTSQVESALKKYAPNKSSITYKKWIRHLEQNETARRLLADVLASASLPISTFEFSPAYATPVNILASTFIYRGDALFVSATGIIKTIPKEKSEADVQPAGDDKPDESKTFSIELTLDRKPLGHPNLIITITGSNTSHLSNQSKFPTVDELNGGWSYTEKQHDDDSPTAGYDPNATTAVIYIASGVYSISFINKDDSQESNLFTSTYADFTAYTGYTFGHATYKIQPA